MKKILFVIVIAFMLSGCEFFAGLTTTTRDYAQLDEEDLENIKNQVMNELRQEIQNEYAQQLTDVENMVIDAVRANADAVLGVSNFANMSGVLRESSRGSGVIYKKVENDYYVITNEHVVEGYDALSVVLADGTYMDAELVGADKMTDLAVIKFNSTLSFPVVQFGDSDELIPGQFAIAIGNPLGYDYYGSVTSGIVSGLSRNLNIDYDDDGVIDWVATLVQHDAAISPGNSGGGLFDITGKLIGINNMKIVENTVSNIGFAIPINTVKFVVEQLELEGEVRRPSLGITGIGVEDVIENNESIRAGLIPGGEIIELPNGITEGVYVSTIVDNSSSTDILQPGDIILKFNEIDIIVFEDLRSEINHSTIGDEVTLTVYRDGETIEITMVLKQRPE